MSHNVFISFSSKNNETALRIYDGLTNREVKCWISSKHVPPGGNFMNEIVSALSSSSVMVLIYSHDANLSKEIEKELALAGKYQLTVIPLKIDDVEPSGAFEYSFSTSQWIEVFPNIENTLDTVAVTIKTITERTEKFAHEVQQALEEDGVIEPTDQKYLEDEVGVRMGLTAAQSRAIIKRVIGDSARSTVQDRESDYLKLIDEVLEDGKISSLEKRRLADRARSLGIDDVRAEVLLEQEKCKKGIAENSRPVVNALPRVEEHIASRVDDVEKHSKADDGLDRKGEDAGHSVDRPAESHLIPDTAGESSNLGFVDSYEETPWEYFQLGNMTADQVLESPDSADLAGYIAFYAIGDEEDTGPVLDQLKKASPGSLVKDVVEDYADFVDADWVGDLSVSDARNWSLARVIKKLIEELSLNDIERVIDKKNGNTKIRKAFFEHWPDTEASDEEQPDDALNWDYLALGEMRAGEVLAHPERNDLIQGIAMFADKTERTVRKYLEESNPAGLVKDVVKNYQDILDPDVLASMNIATARDLELGKVIAQVLEISDLAEVQRILDDTNGNTKVWKAFVEYWPDTEADD